MHTAYCPDLDPLSTTITLTGDERDHAVRTKRMRPGDELLLFDGKGTIARCCVLRTSGALELEIISTDTSPKPACRVEICCPVPKGPRASTLIDLLSQVGADAWRPLESAYSEQTASPARVERLTRVAQEALKQCRRPWLLDFYDPIQFIAALEGPDQIILAEASGDSLENIPRITAGAIRVLVGPEGGWRDDELDLARQSNVPIVRFGDTVMRIETAAAVSCALILEHTRRSNEE
jgi:16S rRNA (uracil1498-N3)-methyltransferase